jgi:hypothetical protein
MSQGGGKSEQPSKGELEEGKNLVSFYHTPISLYLPLACDALNGAR